MWRSVLGGHGSLGVREVVDVREVVEGVGWVDGGEGEGISL